MSVLAIVTLAVIVINFFWTKVAHDDYVGDVSPAWISRVTNVPWSLANIVWWLFAAIDAYLCVQFYSSGDVFLVAAGVTVLVYAFSRRTPKEYRNFMTRVVSKISFLPVWVMVVVGMMDRGLVYFSLFFALWSLVASVMQGRFIFLTRMLSAALEDTLRREEEEAEAQKQAGSKLP